MRTERPASNSGTVGGGKPEDLDPDLRAECGKGASPVPDVDERNLCLKRRKVEQVKWLRHLAQKGRCLCLVAYESTRGISCVHPAYSRQLRIAGTCSHGTGEL